MKEQAVQYYQQGLNCAEAVVKSADEFYKLNLGPQGIRLASGFGGGMATGGVCGAVTGSIMILGMLYGRDESNTDAKAKSLTQRFQKTFLERMGHCDCKVLIPQYRSRDKVVKCSKVVSEAAQLLEELVAEG